MTQTTRAPHWTAGEVVAPTPDASMWQAGIDVPDGKDTHYSAIVVYGVSEREATDRRDFILRAVTDHVGRGMALSDDDVEALAQSCGLTRLRIENQRTANPAPDYVGGTWRGVLELARALPSHYRRLLHEFRGALVKALGASDDIPGHELIAAVQRLKEGLPPALTEPSAAQVQAFIDTFHGASANRDITYAGAVQKALKAAMLTK